MRRENQAFRALSVAVLAVRAEIEGDAVTDPLEIESSIRALGLLLARLRLARVDAEILQFVAEQPGATCNRIALAVAGDRPRVLARIKTLEARGLLRRESGAQGARNWYRGKTSEGLPTARATA